ncbi:MAG: hypothetical protein OEY61_02220 [Gammaproteobacteria bacterium]|nr:hypothetical protein [Gammaproteobacteria bacterium]
MFKSDQIDEFYFNAVNPSRGIAERVDIDKELIRLRSSTRRLASKHLQLWIILIDEGIHFLIHLERLLATRDKMGVTRFNLLTLIAKLKSLAISFRELILLGQADSSRLLLRGFIETSDITLPAMADPIFCAEYAEDNPEHDDNKFWKNKIAYGKIYPVIKSALKKADFEDDQIDSLIQWKKNWKSQLSGAVHAASWSSFQSCLIPSLSEPGMFVEHPFGHLSAYSPELCNVIIQELLILSSTFEGLLVSTNMPSHLKGYPTGPEYASTLSSSNTMHEFFYKFYDDLFIPIEELIPDLVNED